jgi:hypothetical protein
MLTFSAWVLFLLAVILSVPVMHFVETSRAKKARGDQAKEAAVADDTDESVVEEAEISGEAEDDFAAFGEEKPAGVDDFSAFEEEFK